MSVQEMISERKKMIAEMERERLITDSIMITFGLVVGLFFLFLLIMSGLIIPIFIGSLLIFLLFCLVYKTLKSRLEKKNE